MTKHKTHRVPTCRKCQTQHYNMQACPVDDDPPTGSLTIVHRADRPMLDMSVGSVAASGDWVGGSRVDKHPARRMAITGGNA